jgi:hypothetical protein
MTELKARRRLNAGQVEVLELLYKFRYGSNDLIAEYFGKKDRSFVYNRLKILQDYKLIGKRFDKSYRIQGKPAAYHLLPEGARVLMASKPGLRVNIKSIYDDDTRSEEFISRCLDLFAISNHLKSMYGDKLKFFPKSTLAVYDYFPKPLPDAYISLKIGNDTRRMFMELFDSNKPPFAVDQRLRQLIEYYQSGEWQTKGSPFPPILCICEDGASEKRLQKQINRALFRSGEEVGLYTTTINAFMHMRSNTDAVWTSTSGSDVLVALKDLQ